MNVGEIIQIHIGQAGIQLGNAIWELYCVEHGINLDGTLQDCSENAAWNSLFNCTSCRRVVPRLLMIDSEAVVLDEIKVGPYGKLFKCDSLLCGKEDSGNNFARGYCTVGNELLEQTVDALRRVAEECQRLEGFFLFRAIGGGTGSGFGTKILESITDNYGPKSNKIEYAIYPSPSVSPVVVESLNTVLAIHGASALTDSTLVFNNDALYNIFDKKLFVECPTFTNLNRIIAQVISSMSAGIRFDSPLAVGIRDLKTNLVPFPRIHYSVVSYAPLLPIKRPCQESLTTEKITNEALNRDNLMTDVNFCDGLMMASILLYRGNLTTAEVTVQVKNIKSKIPSVCWHPSPIKLGLTNCGPICLQWGDLLPTPRALCMLSNTTAIRHYFAKLLVDYKTLLEKRAFLFHYIGEGIEEGALIEAGDNLCALINEYEEYNAQDMFNVNCEESQSNSDNSKTPESKSGSGSTTENRSGFRSMANSK